MIHEIKIGERTRRLDSAGGGDAAWVDDQTLSLVIGGRVHTVTVLGSEKTPTGTTLTLTVGGREFEVEARDPRRLLAQRRAEQTGRVGLKAPMAGKVVRLLAAPGEAVEAGQGLMVLEAMKMQNEVRSPKSGRLISLAVAAGATVSSGQLLAEVE